MARANPAPIRFRRELHWPRRQRIVHPTVSLVRVPVDPAAPDGVTLRQAMLIVAGTLVGCGALAEGAIALVRWSVPV